MKFRQLTDTNWISLKYGGDFGRINNVYYSFKNTIPDGHYQVYINDTLQHDVTYNGGKKNGKYRDYYEDGTTVKAKYKSDTITGISSVYNSKGRITKRTLFSEGHLILMTVYNVGSDVSSHTFYIHDNWVRFEKFSDFGKTLTVQNMTENKQTATVRLNTALQGKKQYRYNEGVFRVTYRNNDITKCLWLPLVVNPKN